MLESLLTQLQDANTRLHRMEQELSELIQENESAISSIKSFLEKSQEQPPLNAPKKELPIMEKNNSRKDAEMEQSLKTIRQLWEENGIDQYLLVHKPSWTPDFCFCVHAIDGDKAIGVTYVRLDNGDISVYKNYKSYSCDKAEFSLLSSTTRLWIDVTNMEASGELAAEEHAVCSASDHENDIPPYIRVNSTVTLEDMDSKETMTVLIVQSTEEIRFTTMGYRKKNNVERTQTSTADGVTSTSNESLLGKAILGKGVGDCVEYQSGGELQRFRILSVSNPK